MKRLGVPVCNERLQRMCPDRQSQTDHRRNRRDVATDRRNDRAGTDESGGRIDAGDPATLRSNPGYGRGLKHIYAMPHRAFGKRPHHAVVTCR